jgi:uncharacterized protein YecE (DUF72 family)
MARTKKVGSGLYVGTSGWGYPSWKPDFYPKEVKTKDFLHYYATQFNATEVNYTFRRTVTENVQQQWIADTPEHFRFVLKASQYITHIRRLKDTDESVERFFTSVGVLASSGKLGPVLFQLPPNLKADVPRLREFLESLPPGALTAWEFRHESWFSEETYEVLSDYDSALCLAENETMTTPQVMTAGFAYYRFRNPSYTPERLKEIAAELKALAATREVYAFFKHEEDPKSASWAADVLKMGTAGS